LLSKRRKDEEKPEDVRKLIEKANHKEANVCAISPFFGYQQ